MRRDTTNREGSWRGWARGCLVVLVVLVAAGVLIGSWLVTIGPVREAIEARETLVGLYGPQEGYTPLADGVVPAARMEAFLRVRRQLAEACARLGEASEAAESLSRLEVEISPKPQAVAELWQRSRSAIGLEARRGEFFRARNVALLDAEMGLGEYSWIFVLAYGPRLVSDRDDEGLGLITDFPVLPRVRRLLVDMLRRQLAAVEGGLPGAERDTWSQELAAEIERLEEDPRRIPWMDRLPPPIAASVEPYRQRLDESWCEAASSLELMRNEKSGLGFHGH